MSFLKNYDKDKVQTAGLLLFLFFDLILSFILPLLLIRKLLKTIPELFRNSIAIAPSKFVFYMRQPEFSPREDVVRISNSPVCKYAVSILNYSIIQWFPILQDLCYITPTHSK